MLYFLHFTVEQIRRNFLTSNGVCFSLQNRSNLVAAALFVAYDYHVVCYYGQIVRRGERIARIVLSTPFPKWLFSTVQIPYNFPHAPYKTSFLAKMIRWEQSSDSLDSKYLSLERNPLEKFIENSSYNLFRTFTLSVYFVTRCKKLRSTLTPFMNNKYQSFYNALRNFGLCFCIFEEMTRDFFTQGWTILCWRFLWFRTKAKYCEGKRRCQSFLLMGYRTPGELPGLKNGFLPCLPCVSISFCKKFIDIV